MRIAFVTTEYITESNYSGGLANYLYRIAKYLTKLGHEPVIIVVSKHDYSSVNDNVRIHRVKVSSKIVSLINYVLLKFISRSINTLLISWKLRKAILHEHNNKPFDIVQYASSGAIGFFRVSSIPSVIRINSYAPLNRKAYGDHNNSFDVRVFDKIDLLALKKADGLFGPSKAIASVIERKINNLVSVIESPIYIETDDLSDQPYYDLLDGKKYLLFFGTLGLLKGLFTIAEVINDFLERNKDFYFVFIGNDIGYQGKPVMDYIWSKAGPNRGRVIYMGKMRHVFLYPILKNSYAVVLPSRVDNFPNVCLEAMAFGKIVLGTSNTSFEEIIIDGENGFLCEPDNSQDLLEKLEYIVNLDSLDYKRVENNSYLTSKKYGPDIIGPKLISYYGEVIEKSKMK